MPQTVQQRKVPPNVLRYMAKLADDAAQGPMAALGRFAAANDRVEVRTRGIDRVRGVCTGFLVAFDKYWNLVLVDVDEKFVRRRRGKQTLDGPVTEGPRLEDGMRTERMGDSLVLIRQTKRKTLVCERHVAQLLVRGEHVVAVSKAM